MAKGHEEFSWGGDIFEEIKTIKLNNPNYSLITQVLSLITVALH